MLDDNRPISQVIAQHLELIVFERLPPAVVVASKRAFLDTVGVALAGAHEACVRLLIEESGALSSRGVTLFGHRMKAPPKDAALINGTAAHALDLDDTGASTQGHPSAVLVPALLALAEHDGLSGARVLEAYVAGVEVMSCLSRQCPELHRRGWHPTSVLGVIAVTAANARLLRLTPQETCHALGVSASVSSGVVANFGSMTKPLHAGLAAAHGVFCARMARGGFTAAPGALDITAGLLGRLNNGDDKVLRAELSHLGERFRLLDPGMHVKRYPSCALSHRIIDIVLDLVMTHAVTPGQVVAVRCRATPKAFCILNHARPRVPLEGKFSVPFLVAAAIRDRGIGPGTFSEDALACPLIRTLMEKTEFRIDEDWVESRDTWRADSVEMELANGCVIRGECVYPKGHAGNPMSDEELLEKFASCAGTLLTKEQEVRLRDAILHLEQTADVRDIMPLFTPGLSH